MASECDVGMIMMFNTPSRSLDAPEGGERNLFCEEKKLDVVVQTSWISSKLKLGGECKNDDEESDYTAMGYRL